MKKYLTKSWLADLLVSCHTITLWGLINTKKKELSQNLKNHECIHVAQWMETMYISYIVVTILVLCGISAWWLLLPPSVFYVWYIVEWIIRICLGQDAYRNISFEREAYTNEADCNYNENRNYFAFIKYLKK